MSEINITALIENEVDLWPCYGSVATHGLNAAQTTWNAAKEQSKDTMFVSDDNRDDIKNHFLAYGAWTDEEISKWDDIELNALLVQDICGAFSDCSIDLDILDFSDEECLNEVSKMLENPNFGGRVFLTDDNELYFYVGL